MGLFSTKVKKNNLPWVQIQSVAQLQEIMHSISDQPKLFFKHSTRCVVSNMALRSFESNWSVEEGACDLYFIDLLQHRDVSNEVEALTGIAHQSPQVIVIKGREIIYDETHSAIEARRIESAIRKA